MGSMNLSRLRRCHDPARDPPSFANRRYQLSPGFSWRAATKSLGEAGHRSLPVIASASAAIHLSPGATVSAQALQWANHSNLRTL